MSQRHFRDGQKGTRRLTATKWTTDPNNSRIKWRTGPKGRPKAYGDFRDFTDVGGKQEALKTDDASLAELLVSRRLTELQDLRNKKLLGVKAEKALGEYAEHHLNEKAEHEDVLDRTLEYNELCLERAIAFFGVHRPLTSITVSDMSSWVSWLKKNIPTKKGRDVPSGSALNSHLNALSNLYRRAVAEDVVPVGFNPVQAMLSKPSQANAEDPEWFEHDEACAILEAARRYAPPRRATKGYLTQQRAWALVATHLFTGGRRNEVAGLLKSDVNFSRKTIRFRENDYRRLKTAPSRRVITLWPQLENILREYLDGPDAPKGELLFPSPRMSFTGKGEHMITDFRKTLDNIGEILGWKPESIRTKAFRHTYCAARLQTLDHGHPVSIYTVSQEMGHGGIQMVKRVYGHLGKIRHRGEVVEYPEETGRSWINQNCPDPYGP
jgi:integrase